jgi:transposase
LRVWGGVNGLKIVTTAFRAKDLKSPENISFIPLSPYSRQLNLVENFWKELKKQGFDNRVFTTLDEVEDQLENQLKYFQEHPEYVQSIVGYGWILDALN